MVLKKTIQHTLRDWQLRKVYVNRELCCIQQYSRSSTSYPLQSPYARYRWWIDYAFHRFSIPYQSVCVLSHEYIKITISLRIYFGIHVYWSHFKLSEKLPRPSGSLQLLEIFLYLWRLLKRSYLVLIWTSNTLFVRKYLKVKRFNTRYIVITAKIHMVY